MSDILIKNMKMPESCAECQFSDVFAYPPDYDDEWICELNYLSMTWEDAQMRHSNCPLVEIPQHGDLIDRDAIQYANNTTFDEDYVRRKTIMKMPTIIEAEGKT